MRSVWDLLTKKRKTEYHYTSAFIDTGLWGEFSLLKLSVLPVSAATSLTVLHLQPLIRCSVISDNTIINLSVFTKPAMSTVQYLSRLFMVVC